MTDDVGVGYRETGTIRREFFFFLASDLKNLSQDSQSEYHSSSHYLSDQCKASRLLRSVWMS